ncbi:hypothetical protein NDU88_001615 [Pleurodeles waltl]|uniref:Uncharacterized protein n=1 Tax=Pleurodeles waltl TaxID=8319 RepID=A0AAV7V8U7_PLEWA|nr:hypothetical protein NDU88_001615 [Pleurodeles waltl]
MAGTGHLRSGTGVKSMQEGVTQDSKKLDTVLAAVECIGDSLERARTYLESKIDKVTSDLTLLHADHRKLADKTGILEARIDELVPTTSWLEASLGDALTRIGELERRAEGRTRRNNIRVIGRSHLLGDLAQGAGTGGIPDAFLFSGTCT